MPAHGARHVLRIFAWYLAWLASCSRAWGLPAAGNTNMLLESQDPQTIICERGCCHTSHHPAVALVCTYKQLRRLGLQGAADTICGAIVTCIATAFQSIGHSQDGSLAKQVMRQMSNPGRHLYTELQALSWLAGIARALAYVHARGAAHRDIKLENILLAR